MNRLGVCVVGLNGAVSSTMVAGTVLMRMGLAPRAGMVADGPACKGLPFAPLESLVFGGWDLRKDSVFEAAVHHAVVPASTLEPAKEELSALKPWPAVATERFLGNLRGDENLVKAKSFREEIAILEQNVKDFMAKNGLTRCVILNLTSTERACEVEDVHRTIAAFEQGLDKDDPRISPAMKYLYVACKLGLPHANFTPSLTKVPALEQLAEQSGVPICGEDGKTGQTFVKTVLAPAFAARRLLVDGWYSTNILGNNDGLILNDPASNKTKVTSKRGVLDEILGYKVENHQVHIHYYKPRGDAKEAWDNIDLVGFLGERMQMKVNFLCKDSILAAPLALDLVRLLDVAKRAGERGIQRQFSAFFKAPYHTEGELPVHDFFKQNDMLVKWAERVGPALRAQNGHDNGKGRTANGDATQAADPIAGE
ncbi:MAG TPA: inositol-3-phosphate synthase [Minicystis sp.]|nr:inositol-3-phosphate synthase [Minicystis sp.]